MGVGQEEGHAGLRDHVDEKAWMQDLALGLVSWADSSQVCSEAPAASASH